MATVSKRNRSGVVTYRVRWVDPAGKERSKTFPGGQKELANDFANGIEEKKNQGTYIDPRKYKTQVGSFIPTLLGSKNSRGTKTWYSAQVGRVTERWNTTPFVSVTHDDVQQWVNDMRDAGIGPHSIHASYVTLHQLVKMALRGRIISFDPCADVRLPKIIHREMLFLTPAQIVMLASWIERVHPGQGFGLLVRFTAYAGLRAGEVGGLLVKDFDLLHRQVHVQRNLTQYGDGPLKSGSKGRWVDLPHQLCELLEAWIIEQDLQPNDRMWCGERRGAPLNHRWFFEKRYKPIVIELTEAGELPFEMVGEKRCTLRFHDLRHTCVALLISQGAQQYEVMEHLGHTRIQTTIDTYGHLFPRVRERIRAHLEEVWDEAS